MIREHLLDMADVDTIFALSSGNPPAGIAIVRLSGPGCKTALKLIIGGIPEARRACLHKFTDPDTRETVDTGLVLFFPGPASFTGEDVVEFHLHGGSAVVRKFLKVLASISGLRLANAGEYSLRAFENGRFDLTEIEGLSDLISAETENQRKQAISQSGGRLRKIVEGWQQILLHNRAYLEASIDFSEEDDVDGKLPSSIWSDIQDIKTEMADCLDDERSGEIVRDGYRIAIMGPTNVGKSSLINALAKRDVAIVSEIPGTTRDVLEVHLDLGGYQVIFVDTAGIRDTVDEVELMGIARAHKVSEQSDLVLWLMSNDQPILPYNLDKNCIIVCTKMDLTGSLADKDVLSISSLTGENLDALLDRVTSEIRDVLVRESSIITRYRHRSCIEDGLLSLSNISNTNDVGLEVLCEHLRSASHAIGGITGQFGVEDVLDVIFSEFCIGK